MRTEPGDAVLLTSADPIFRGVLAEGLLAVGSGPREVREAASVGEAVLDSVVHGPGALAVVDLELPDPTVDGLIVDLLDGGWSSVVVVAASGRADRAVAALAAGASGLLVEHRHVARPERDRSRPLGAPTTAGHGPAPDVGAPEVVLTPREQALLTLVADGSTNREIARELDVSPLTVKAHLVRIGGKLGSGDRAVMVLVALRAGWID